MIELTGRNLPEIDALAGEGVSFGGFQIMQHQNLFLDGNLAFACQIGHRHRRPTDPVRATEVRKNQAGDALADFRHRLAAVSHDFRVFSL